ncbi:MAG: probable exported protease [uncultured Friedmanniella sp.]|uniref:Probable exported protease n=1 Tax=uncultured Friedmanniella sp. TaxID=335381 RepID=A0A6J4K875_9ACTN|nr:alpha/beta hydrolase [uncultured Friedmanniella sp.]CAA9298177.1 MAG: probable exported protease [uncultured Friedmanniella sp.]
MPAACRRLLASGLFSLLLVTACSAGATDRSPAPEPAPAPATVTPTAPSLPAQGRPVRPMPDVRPAGFAAPPPGSGLQRYRNQELAWKPCGRQLQCASVLAPLDYDAPDGQALTLALSKRKATRQPRLGTLFLNPGGPGGSGRGYVDFFDVRGLEAYDVVGWDPRGVGSSTPVRCYGSGDLDRYFSVDVSPDDAAEEESLRAEVYAFGGACLEHSGPLLRHISTAATVRDLDLLRELVDDPRLHYFGASYELYPDTVGRMVLDGAVNITGQQVSQLEGFERALGHFAEWAATQGTAQSLGASRSAVLSRIRQLLTGLDEAPLPGSGGRSLSQQQAVQGVVTSLYGREQWAGLLRALVAADEGDGRPLLALADRGNHRYQDGSYGQINASFPAIRCLDSQATSIAGAERSAKRRVKKAPVLGPFAGADLVCPLWPVAPAPKQPRIDAEGAAPIVVLGTTGDPATPVENAQGMAQQLASGVLVTLEGEGHTAYDQSECVRRLVVPYLVGQSVPEDGSRCPS